MSCKQNMWKMDKSLRLLADCYLINVAYRENGNDGIAKMLFEIRTLRQERGYMDKQTSPSGSERRRRKVAGF